MCVKNINANILTCASITNTEGVRSINSVFNVMECQKTEEGTYKTDPFSVMMFLSAIGSDNNSPFGKKFDLRLTLVNKETKGAKKLTDYKYDPYLYFMPANNQGQCKDFSVIRLVLDVEPFVLDEGLGEYVLKLWLKDVDSPDDWKVQTMQILEFQAADK